MTMDDVSLGEVYRLVQAVRTEHGGQLSRIHEQTTLITGQVGRHAERLDVHDREIEALRGSQSRAVWTGLGLIVTVVGGVIVSWVAR